MKKKENDKKKSAGITLIALVVTIIQLEGLLFHRKENNFYVCF